MHRTRGLRDRRYTVTLEYCGYAKPRHVARFCGDWLGQARSRRAAVAIVHVHADRRQRFLTDLATGSRA